GVVHRRHLRAEERCGIFEERAENLPRDVARQQLGKDLVLVGLVFVHRAVLIAVRAGEYRWNDLMRGRQLRHYRLESREEEGADVERALLIEPQNPVGDAL